MNTHPCVSGKNWRAMLTALGGYDNDLVPVPAGGVREIISDVEALTTEVAELKEARDILVAQLSFMRADAERWREVKRRFDSGKTSDDATRICCLLRLPKYTQDINAAIDAATGTAHGGQKS